MSSFRKWLSQQWCSLFHSGTIERDSRGRINWHCNQCGRWSDYPVPLTGASDDQ